MGFWDNILRSVGAVSDAKKKVASAKEKVAKAKTKKAKAAARLERNIAQAVVDSRRKKLSKQKAVAREKVERDKKIARDTREQKRLEKRASIPRPLAKEARSKSHNYSFRQLTGQQYDKLQDYLMYMKNDPGEIDAFLKPGEAWAFELDEYKSWQIFSNIRLAADKIMSYASEKNNDLNRFKLSQFQFIRFDGTPDQWNKVKREEKEDLDTRHKKVRAIRASERRETRKSKTREKNLAAKFEERKRKDAEKIKKLKEKLKGK